MTAQHNETSVPCGDCGGKEGLKSKEGRIHCAAADVPDEGGDELHQIDVRNFIDALADIALAVAPRRQDLEL